MERSRSRKQLITKLAEEASLGGKSKDKKQETPRDSTELLRGSHKIVKKVTDDSFTEEDLEESSEENPDSDEADKEQDVVPDEFKQKVILYTKIDDLIREKAEELKELKDKRKPHEEYILNYLDKKDIPSVNLKSGKLIKNKAESTSPIKLDIIKDSIIECIKQEDDLSSPNDIKCKDVSDKIIELMNSKRTKTTRMALKRTFARSEGKEKTKRVTGNSIKI